MRWCVPSVPRRRTGIRPASASGTPGGTYRYEIRAHGTYAVRGSTLVLRPQGGTQVRHDPGDPQGDYERPLRKLRQRYEWSVRGSGPNARLRLTIGGGLAVTFRRQ